MSLYTNFFGIDTGKFNFAVSIYGAKSTQEYKNFAVSISRFVEEHKCILSVKLSLHLETTGGYHLEVLYSLVA